MSDGLSVIVDTSTVQAPKFIAVEGPIGVGKTTLARHLAATFQYQLLRECPEANPFLERFYENPRAAALPTQLFFLFQRVQQFQDLRQQDMFEDYRVADFLLDKDRLFAEVTLDQYELDIYRQVYQQLDIEVPSPDLVIYLQAPDHVLVERVRQRGLEMERNIDSGYLSRLNDAYMRFFHFYERSPLLIVNAAELDLAGNPQHYAQLVDYLLNIRSGRHYYNPYPTL